MVPVMTASVLIEKIKTAKAGIKVETDKMKQWEDPAKGYYGWDCKQKVKDGPRDECVEVASKKQCCTAIVPWKEDDRE